MAQPAERRKLDWLKNLFGGSALKQLHADGQNPIHAWLDACDIPWRESRGDLIARYGITQQADRAFEAVEIDGPEKPIKGLIRPLYFQLSEHYSPHVPAIEFIGDAYYAPDEGTNIRRVAKELSAYLGPANVEGHLNTLRAIWTFDRARVRLLAWPREKQRPRSSWEKDERDPRLKLGCYITIHTGFLPSATEAEHAQLETFVPICSLPPSRGVGIIDNWYVNQSELEFVREPTAFSEIGRTIGTSSDRSALIFRAEDLFIFKMTSVQAIYVERTQPAKGPGGSALKIEVLGDYPGISVKKITVCESPGADDLNEIGEVVANVIGKPLKLSPYYSDC